MKKMILSVAIMLAAFGVAQANKMNNNTECKIETLADVVSLNSNTPHIICMYDVDRIIIKNDFNAHIRIYNSKWEVIADTNENVELFVEPGNYYIASDKNIKTKYIIRN